MSSNACARFGLHQERFRIIEANLLGLTRKREKRVAILLTYLLILAVPVTAVALLYARWGYRTYGKLTFFGVFLLCLMFFVPNLIVEYATRYKMPETPLNYLGFAIAILGVAICTTGVIHFRSMSKVFCVETGELTVSGLYRWSRNPQYVGYLLFLLGFTLNDWSLWCLAALLVVAVSVHFLVLVEEEHLQRVFGEQYVEYCRNVPRYVPLGPGRS